MRNPPFTLHGVASRRKPQVTPDSGPANEVVDRRSRYGEGYVHPLWPNDQMLADEESFMVASTLPQATALQLGLSAAFSAVAAAILFQNTAKGSFDGAKRCYPRYLRLNVVTPPTSGTALRFASVLDDKDRTPTTISNGSGGSGPGTPATATCYKAPGVCTSLDGTPDVVGQPYFPLSTSGGAPPAVPVASQNARTIVGNGSLRAQIPVAGDEYIIQFGASDFPQGGLVTAAPAGASRIVVVHPPIVIAPAAWWLFYLWAPSNATAGIAFDGVEMGWVER